MIEDCVIVGGGVAGLSAANQLVDKGMKPLIVDASKYPASRVCGEFFSHECLPILDHWGLFPSSHLLKSRFYQSEKKFELKLPEPCGSFSRFEFDFKLLERAMSKGAQAFLETFVKGLNVPLHASQPYELLLSNGEVIRAHHLIIGTGRIPKLSSETTPDLKYIGFKAHFEMSMDEAVEIHTFKGGYLGLSRISSNKVNVACLTERGLVQDVEHPALDVLGQESMHSLKQRLSKAKMVFPQWLVTEIPEFGIRKYPQWDRVFWVGDAAGSIPPICGEGLAIAVTSGCMAADYLVKSNAQEFRKDWLQRYRLRFLMAQQIHWLMIKPWMAHLAIATCRFLPVLPSCLWKLTRE